MGLSQERFSGRRAARGLEFIATCLPTQASELMSNLWLICVPVILIIALILFFRLTKKP